MALKVAVTGMGIISSLGFHPEEYARRLRNDEVVFEEAPWTRNDPNACVWIGPINNFDPLEYMDEKIERGTDGFSQKAIAAAVEALRYAGIAEDDLDPLRTGLVIGTSMGGTGELMHAQYLADTQGPQAVDPKTMIKIWPNMAAAQMAMRWDLHGPSLTIATACASSLDAIGTGARLIASGAADRVICGGTEGGRNRGGDNEDFVGATSYAQVGYGMAPETTNPRLACRPFDKNRSGMVTGDGSGLLILESEEHARRRGAKVLAWVRGYGSCADGFHPSSPEPTGKWELRAMKLALDESGIAADEIDAIAAHGTGTPKGDIAEIRAINTLYGKRKNPVAVMSVKGHVGHAGGAAGGQTLIAGLQAALDGELNHTGCTTEVDPEVDFEVVIGKPKKMDIRNFQVNAFGFGGQNASLILSRN